MNDLEDDDTDTEFKMNTRHTLRGLTLKGKNRIREHGDVWVSIAEMGGNTLFRSEKDHYLKWLTPDLEVVRETD